MHAFFPQPLPGCRLWFLDDKTLLARVHGGRLEKASVSSYCIKFRALKAIDLDVLGDAERYAVDAIGSFRGNGASSAG